MTGRKYTDEEEQEMIRRELKALDEPADWEESESNTPGALRAMSYVDEVFERLHYDGPVKGEMTNKIRVDALIDILDSLPGSAFLVVSGGTASSAALDAWVQDDDKFVSLGTIIYSSGEWSD